MNHKKFILSPIDNILRDANLASLGVGSGIEAYPLCDYFLQSVFLKMTGAQEQKMKCICWELAAQDYEYRYSKFQRGSIGECSSYTDKNDIYKDLISQIKKNCDLDFKLSLIDKENALYQIGSKLNSIFSCSNLKIWSEKNFIEYMEIWSKIDSAHFLNSEKNFLEKTQNLSDKSVKGLLDIYNENLYKHRNRVAHNTLSYQQNLPTLNTLLDDDYIYDNYFIYFAVLMLIDEIFIQLFKVYSDNFESYW